MTFVWTMDEISTSSSSMSLTSLVRASENIFRLQCKRGSSKWASPHHEQFATFLRNFYIFKQFLGNFEIWASVRRTRRTLFSDALSLVYNFCSYKLLVRDVLYIGYFYEVFTMTCSNGNILRVMPRSRTRIFLTIPYGSPNRSQSQASVNNFRRSVCNSSQLGNIRNDPWKRRQIFWHVKNILTIAHGLIFPLTNRK